jgi:hypothetical protein
MIGTISTTPNFPYVNYIIELKTISINANLFPFSCYDDWCTPKLLDGLNYDSKGEDNGRRKSWACSLTYSTLKVESVLELWDGDLEDWQAIQLLTQTCTNQITSWFVRNWRTLVHEWTMGKHRLTRPTMARTWGKPPPSPL